MCNYKEYRIDNNMHQMIFLESGISNVETIRITVDASCYIIGVCKFVRNVQVLWTPRVKPNYSYCEIVVLIYRWVTIP